MKKIFALLLTFVMIIGMMATTAYATEIGDTPPAEISNEIDTGDNGDGGAIVEPDDDDDAEIVDCASLQAAIDNAAYGATVTLTNDVDMADGTLVVAAGHSIVLDLNGHTISGSAAVANHAMVRNNGVLKVTGNGVITYAYTGTPDGTFGSGNYTVVNSGTMIVENGKIVNATADMTHCFLAIDNNSTVRDVSLTVNGGSVICNNYRSVRQFANSSVNKNDLIVNGGEFVGQIWTQSPNAQANLASVEINGGSFRPTGKDGSSVYVTNSSNGNFDVAVTGGYFATKIGTDNPDALAGAITGGTFTEDAKTGTNEALFSSANTMTDNGDGTYTSTKANVADTTIVEHVGNGVEEYEITVPEKLAPGASGNVYVSGTWGAHRQLTVSASDKVTLTHSLRKSDTKVLDVFFDAIKKMGDNCYDVAAEGVIAVANIANALFGTWTGTIVYTVSFATVG